MTTATLTEQETTLAADVPAIPFVEWPRFFDPSDDDRAAIAKLSGRFEATDASEAAFQVDVTKLVDESLGQPFRECGEGGKQFRKAEKLLQRAGDLWLLNATVRHERPILMVQLLPTFDAATRTAKEMHERLAVDEVGNMRAIGLADAFPGASANPEAAEYRLRQLAEQKEWVMAARADFYRAEQARINAESVRYNFPQEPDCRVNWPTFAGLAGEVARLLGLVPSGPRPSLLQRLEAAAASSDTAARNLPHLKLARLLRETSLERVAMLPAHEDALEALIELIDDYETYPLQHVKPGSLPQARELVKRLPQTLYLWRWLQETKGAALTRE